MSEHAFDTIGKIHCKIKTCDRSIAPSDHGHFRNVEVVQNGDCIGGEVIVVEFGEVGIRAATLASRAARIVRYFLSQLIVEWWANLLTLAE